MWLYYVQLFKYYGVCEDDQNIVLRHAIFMGKQATSPFSASEHCVEAGNTVVTWC